MNLYRNMGALALCAASLLPCGCRVSFGVPGAAFVPSPAASVVVERATVRFESEEAAKLFHEKYDRRKFFHLRSGYAPDEETAFWNAQVAVCDTDGNRTISRQESKIYSDSSTL